ncbi:hypothetical protein BRD04_01355 [Halobacteriales archaeon QS_9_67_17]|nr:MAG: hypothetical protein BRD04_01355 [Halobacteriales archaeon QS_9_67_17]
MSTADPASTLAAALPAAAPTDLASAAATIGHFARGTAFWAGILLAFAQVPMLASGITAERPGLLAALLAVNVAAMAVGSGHRA